MIRNIFIGLVVLVAIAVGVAFVLPQHPHTQRETIIAATPEQVFAVVDNMARWNDWAPWASMDPDMKQKFDGPAKGVGDLLRHVGIDVAPSGRELDPEVLFHLVINEPADDGRGHERPTLQAASGAGTPERSLRIAAAMPPRASNAPAMVRPVQR